MIRRFEEISNNAWPAIHTIQYDGWLLRFANGVTKRSNSVSLLYPSAIDPEKKITFCEKTYKARAITPCFKITSIADPTDIDQKLEKRGYYIHSRISFQTRELTFTNGTRRLEMNSNYDFHQVKSGFGKFRHSEFISSQTILPDGMSVTIDAVVNPRWMDDFLRMNGFDPARKETYIKIMALTLTPKCLVSVMKGDRIVGVGLGVLEDAFIGLFDIVIDPEFRNRGLGQLIVEIILHWGKNKGAKTGYLQVLSNNIPAIHLYRKTGFSEIYQYHYRMPGNREDQKCF